MNLLRCLSAVCATVLVCASAHALTINYIEDSTDALHVELSDIGPISDHTENSPSGAWSVTVIMYQFPFTPAEIADDPTVDDFAETAVIVGRLLPAPWPELAIDGMTNTFRSLGDFPVSTMETASTGETFYGFGELAEGSGADPSTWDWKFTVISENAAYFDGMSETVPDSVSSVALVGLFLASLTLSRRFERRDR